MMFVVPCLHEFYVIILIVVSNYMYNYLFLRVQLHGDTCRQESTISCDNMSTITCLNM